MPDAAGVLLAIDTATETAGIALYDGARSSELIWPAGRHQTAAVLIQVQHMLRLNGLERHELGALAVVTGPGSFNGLRVGMSLAKGLAYGLRLPIVGVETLDVAAYPHASARMPIRAFVPAGRGRVVFADYRHRYGKWVRLSDLGQAPIDEVARGLSARTLLVGELTREQQERLGEQELVVLPPPALRVRRPSYLAEIAFDRWRSGDVDPVEALDLVYVHGTSPAEGARAAVGG